MKFDKNELVKSPLNYTGGKYKLLPQILPLFPDNINTFIDLFSGGCNVGVNINANKVVCNDILTPVINLMNYFKLNTPEQLINNIESIIQNYGLSETSKYGYEYYGCNSNYGVSKYNKEKYMKLRDDYNTKDNSPLMFYVVLIFAFNNQIRFNSRGEYKESVNKRDFNDSMKKNLIKFVNKINTKNIEFRSIDFRKFDFSKLDQNDFVYIDPPYLITLANYNKDWTENDDRDLLALIDQLNERGIRFAFSNVLESKGKSNEMLKEWCKKYNVHILNFNYINCNYGTKNRDKTSTIEVLITNYKTDNV